VTGSSICLHKRQSECKECGESSICEHDRRRSQCKECLGSGICPHVTLKSVDSKALKVGQAIGKSLSLSFPISPSTIEQNCTNDISCGAKVLELRRDSSVQF
jgi:hypothetical protein